MITVRKALTYIALVGLGFSFGSCTAMDRIENRYHLVPKDSYCLQLEKPLSEYFHNDIKKGASADEIYTTLENIAKNCGK
jgi:hypothetical protein